MIKNQKLKEFFGVGPIGVLVTVIIWSVAMLLDRLLNIPQLVIPQTLRITLILIFIFDSLYLLIGSNYQLRKRGSENKLLNEGPYQFIRHPIYSTWIYSFTGLLSMTLLSWTVIISVIPINFFWSWLVTFEENKMLKEFGGQYQEYMNKSGQFLPSWKAMKESIEENN